MPDKHIDTITKAAYKLSNHLLDIVNATKIYTMVPSWGYKDPNSVGGWNGMLGQLHRGEADIGTPLFLTTDRVSLIEYISMTTPTQARFVFRAPPLSYVQNLYLLPFDRGVWLASLIFILLMIFVISCTSMLETDENTGVWITVSNSFLLSLGAICQQSPPKSPRYPAGRIVTLFLFVAVMFLYTSYTANIVSLLQARTYSIRTLKDLLKSPLKIGVDDIVYNHYYFSTATDPVRKEIYEKKVAPKNKKPNFFSQQDGINKMRQGLFAFHMERGAGYKVVSETFYEDEKCGLMEIDFLKFNDPWMPVQKRSPYKEIFKVNMFKIRESGIQSREIALHYTKKPVCTTGGASFVSVGLVDCYFAGFLLAAGIAISICILVIELLSGSCRIKTDDVSQNSELTTNDTNRVNENIHFLE
ncbi:glutamate receptor ionotropic, NMDA 1-like [Ctenocephalides felis]|uniref:glutamate receptor ionotropic, NMDA 1-like n=1 Tax=Ctenocephalides felis TaxID=7515 RepID=UPI000E6E3C53|nr:glutamate receptor ionotropic, NMDA 1-like [Ctenocephalides felis]